MENSSVISKTFEKEGLGKIKIAWLNGKLIFNMHDACFNLGYTKKNGKGTKYLFKDRIENVCESLDIWGVYITYTNKNSIPFSGKDKSLEITGVDIASTNKIEITKDIDFENTWLSEKDFYALCLESHAKNAKPFREWVTGDVLPSIRETGQYKINNNNSKYKIPQTYSEALRELADKVDENKELKDEVKKLEPKVKYLDGILNNPGLVSITQVSKDYGMSGAEMNKLLHGFKVQYKKSGQWLLYTKYDDKGYVHSNTIGIRHNDGKKDIKMNTKWTQKGRIFLYDLLKSKNILPLIEAQQEIMEILQ